MPPALPPAYCADYPHTSPWGHCPHNLARDHWVAAIVKPISGGALQSRNPEKVARRLLRQRTRELITGIAKPQTESEWNGHDAIDELVSAIKHNAGVPLALLPQTNLALPLARLRSPCVYAWIRGDVVLYIGSSANGAGRGLSALHHVVGIAEPIRPEDEMRIFRCATETEARTLERHLIRQIEPKLNQTLYLEPLD